MRETFDWVVHRYGLASGRLLMSGAEPEPLSSYLRRAGVDQVWGVDRLPQMLARAVAKNGQSHARFLLRDLRELRLPRSVDLLTCRFETLNYLLSDVDLRKPSHASPVP